MPGLVVFITGASSGIGAALAREFARRGADLALVARRVDRLESLAAELRAQGRKVFVTACDVTRDGDVERAVEQAKQELGRIDVVVANAGFGVAGKLERLKLDDYRRQFETNVFGMLRTIYSTLDELKRTRGRLALIGSVAGTVSGPEGSPYCMSKFSVRALAKAIYYELRPYGITVTHIAPGFVKSEIHQVDNRGVYHADRKSGPPKWLEMPTDKAARQIVDAIQARRRERIITAHGKAAVFIERHFPWVLRALMSLSAGKVKVSQHLGR